jgi:hypothetical protein
MSTAYTHDLRGSVNRRYPLRIIGGLLMQTSTARIEIALLLSLAEL